MTTVLTLFGAGLVLVAVEILVPGGLLGVVGGLCLLGGVVAAFLEFGPQGGAIASATALLIGALTLYLEFVLLPKTRLARRFSMAETGTGRSQPEIADRAAIVGREAVAVTTLAPSGYIELDGQRYEAFSQSGHVTIGTRLRIIDLDAFRLIVTQIKESS